MPACFQLYKKGSTEPEALQRVDEAICLHFNVPVHPKYWVGGWYNVIGFLIATGKGELGSQELRVAVTDWYDSYPDDIRNEVRKDALEVLAYLEANYTSNNWTEIGRRG